MVEITIDLTPAEADLLRGGLMEWSGPAHGTPELALAMGFKDLDGMVAECRRLADAISAKSPLTAADWTRALVATEIAFASDVWGSGLDWAITQRFDDCQTVEVLRPLQAKLARAGAIQPRISR